MSAESLAKCILLTDNIHKDSFDHEAAQKHISSAGFSVNSFYKKTLAEAAKEADQEYAGYGMYAAMMLGIDRAKAVQVAREWLETGT